MKAQITSDIGQKSIDKTTMPHTLVFLHILLVADVDEEVIEGKRFVLTMGKQIIQIYRRFLFGTNLSCVFTVSFI